MKGGDEDTYTRMMASIRRQIGWGHSATSCKVVRVTEGVTVVIVARHGMRGCPNDPG